jgi:hypothetical protein
MSETEPQSTVTPVVPPVAEPAPVDAPITDEEIASLASRGALFATMAENVHAHEQALARIAARAEADAEAAAKRVADAAAASVERSQPG